MSEKSRAGWTLLLASLGSFMAALDVVIVTTAKTPKEGMALLKGFSMPFQTN